MVMLFFEKPGCAGNARQKKLLQSAGVMLAVEDMLTKAWKQEELEEFFEGKAVSDCFNENAPAIKSGEIDPNTLSKKEAIAMMIQKPILIKRPLIRYKGKAILGFDLKELGEFIPALKDNKLKDPGTCQSKDSCS